MFARPASDLYAAIQDFERVLVVPRVSQYHGPTFLRTGAIFSEQLVVIAHTTFAAFALVQCRAHELWFRFFGSTQEERPRYTPSDCFETFPFPAGWEERSTVD